MFFDYISIILGIVKIYLLKLLCIKRITFCSVPKINCNFHISLHKNTNLNIGKKFKARNNINIRNDKNGTITIGNRVFFNDNVSVNCQKNIKIGDNVSVGHNVIIIDHDHDYKNDMKKYICDDIIIGNNVWIGANSIILKGARIPDNTIIAAGTIVRKGSIEKEKCLVYEKRNYIVKEVE